VSAAAASLKPDSILHELSELWTTTSKDAGTPGASGVLRACAMTLIVFVDDDSDAMALGDTLAQLMRGHPSRAIVIRLRDDTDVLQARVFAQCWMPFGHSQQICCEQVEFSVSPNRMPDIPSIVSPLAAADVPRVIWFRANRMEKVPNIGELLLLGDKMIFDSSRPGSPAFADLRVLAKAGYLVADLAWTRITRLRELIARLLSERELKEVHLITLEYRGSEAPATARYLQAWLRSELPSATVELRRLDTPGTTEFEFVRIQPGIVIRRGSNCAEFEIDGLQQRAKLPLSGEADVLNEELSIVTRDRIFEQALERMTPWTPRS
jgi:glucose-6-phosphate dehydrogenase assembly protein OpcA